MFHAKLNEGLLIKKLIDSIKDLVSDINLEITPMAISLQAMDSSHVALVTLNLNSEGFEEYRCDKPISLKFIFGICFLTNSYVLVNIRRDYLLKFAIFYF